MTKARILIVDDDAGLGALVKVYLERTGLYEVEAVSLPNEAIAVAHAFRPDAALLDIFMPGKDGGTLAKEMSRDPLLHDIPIMFFTSEILQNEAGEREVIRGGMPFLAKSPDPNVLIEAVGRLLLSRCEAPTPH